MILLHMRHIRQAGNDSRGYCSRGTRAWCERYNINYTQFLLHGINVEIIESIGDAFAIEVCQIARAEHAKQQEVSNG